MNADTLKRLSVLTGEIVTWAYVVSAALGAAAAAVATSDAVGAAKVAAVLTAAATALFSAWQTVRSRTPVAKSERGLLPVQRLSSAQQAFWKAGDI